jgi:hypothetical protein
MTETSDQLILWGVVLARFLVPLAIPRYPLPAILAALCIDATDQTIFQQFTSLPLGGYQGYDKALDIYYLTIAYISTLRNWSNHFAFRVSRFLFYYRLVGVVLFEILGWRLLLLILPNTFEYFYIFYEAYRLRWDPRRMTRRLLIGAAALIWIVIKLPQEYWIHVAQLDTTDFVKTNVLGVPIDTSWAELWMAWPGVFLTVGVLVVGIVVAAWRFSTRYLPPADHKLALSADAHQPPFSAEQVRRARAGEAARIWDSALLEKVVLISLVSIIFAQVLPDARAGTLQIAVGVATIVTINTALSHWLARRGIEWAFTLRQFVVMMAVNLGLVLAYDLLASRLGGSIHLGSSIFFVLMLTLLVTLFDRYRQVYLMRFVPGD